MLTDDDRECIRHTVEICKECDWSSESVFMMYVVAIKMDGTAEDVADLDEIRSIINQVYGE